MSKLISYVGYSRVDGALKFRTAANEARIAQLEKLGDTDINMVALPMEMTKASAAKWALTAAFFAKCNEEVFAVFTANAKDENPFAAKPKAAKKESTVTVKRTKTSALDLVYPEIKMTPKEAAHWRRYWLLNMSNPIVKMS
jgi:hypothetical protein